MSKPVAAVAMRMNGGDNLVVVCEDGSVWYTTRVDGAEAWQEHQPVPGSEAVPGDPDWQQHKGLE